MATKGKQSFGRSLAVQYEVALLDKSQSGKVATEERANICFHLLDELIPQLGMYQNVFKMIRDELFEAVYSTELTAFQAHTESSNSAVQRLPYFVLVQRSDQQRNEACLLLEDKIKKLENRLTMREVELQDAQKKIEMLSKETKSHQKTADTMKIEAKKLMDENKRLSKVVGQHQRAQQRMAMDMESRMNQMKSSYGTLAIELDMLRKYKAGYDELEQSFAGSSALERNNSGKVSELEQTIHTLQLGVSLKHQLLELQNVIIEEYDLQLEDHRLPLLHLDTISQFSKDTIELLSSAGQQFVSRIGEITAEMTQLSKCVDQTQDRVTKQKQPRQKRISSTRTLSQSCSDDLSSRNELAKMHPVMAEPSFSCVWNYWKQVSKLERAVPRDLQRERVLSMVNQFYATMLWDDESNTEDAMSILDSLHEFLVNRYLIPDVAQLVYHDLICGVIKHLPSSLSIHLFGDILNGRLDAASFRYVLLLCDFIRLVEWESAQDFKPFATAIYPFLSEDDVEQMTMSFVAFSENRVSNHLIANYIIYLLLKHREPRIVECEARLLQHPGHRSGLLNEIEFTEALETLLPLTSDQLRRRLYLQSQADMPKGLDAVPISRLAQTFAYLGLLQLSGIIRGSLVCNVLEGRSQNLLSATSSSAISRSDSGLPHSRQPFVSLTTLTTASKSLKTAQL
ncbi:uncharacterized protein LOC134181150 [Corticium candelabrum]|uniref:uncharacterized protein LOC134181150 n=1 Tax=Corticium candelabrum TaxID=121492 RepID=UPI002E270602|nr:uncharacterized protein LOC134181150 [Corticium candelabrum]